MTKKNFHVNNNAILPYEYDKVEVFIKDYKPSTNINYIIETYLVINLLKKESRFKEFKHLMKQFYVDISKNLSDSFLKLTMMMLTLCIEILFGNYCLNAIK